MMTNDDMGGGGSPGNAYVIICTTYFVFFVLSRFQEIFFSGHFSIPL